MEDYQLREETRTTKLKQKLSQLPDLRDLASQRCWPIEVVKKGFTNRDYVLSEIVSG